MNIDNQTILTYKNFQNLSQNFTYLAKEIMPNKIIYINLLNDKVQVIIRFSKHDTKVNLIEGTTIPVSHEICNHIDYESSKPLIFEDIRFTSFLIL